MRLIRNFETKVDKKQEERFETTNNTSHFYSTEDKISAIDNWKWNNIKRIVEDKPEDSKIELEFSKYNKNVIELKTKLNLKLKDNETVVNDNLIKAVEAKDIFKSREIIEKLDKNELFSNSKYIATNLNKDFNSIQLVDKAMNSDFVNIKNVLYGLIFKYMGGENE